MARQWSLLVESGAALERSEIGRERGAHLDRRRRWRANQPRRRAPPRAQPAGGAQDSLADAAPRKGCRRKRVPSNLTRSLAVSNDVPGELHVRVYKQDASQQMSRATSWGSTLGRTPV